jgi:hypothetical protein
MGIQEEELGFGEAGQPPVEGGAVLDELATCFLERDEDARCALCARRMDEALQSEDGLARAGPADQQARAVARQAAVAELVEALDPSRFLGKRLSGFASRRDGVRPLKAAPL